MIGVSGEIEITGFFASDPSKTEWKAVLVALRAGFDNSVAIGESQPWRRWFGIGQHAARDMHGIQGIPFFLAGVVVGSALVHGQCGGKVVEQHAGGVVSHQLLAHHEARAFC